MHAAAFEMFSVVLAEMKIYSKILLEDNTRFNRSRYRIFFNTRLYDVLPNSGYSHHSLTVSQLIKILIVRL